MSGPVLVDVPKDQWTLVAKGVSHGFIHQITQSFEYMHTWCPAGSPAPIGEPGVIGMRIAARTIPIESNIRIDIYLSGLEKDGKVRVDTNE